MNSKDAHGQGAVRTEPIAAAESFSTTPIWRDISTGQVGAEPSFSIDDIAAAERVGRTTIKREIRAGRLEAFKIGRLTRITPHAHWAWKARQPRVKPRKVLT